MDGQMYLWLNVNIKYLNKYLKIWSYILQSWLSNFSFDHDHDHDHEKSLQSRTITITITRDRDRDRDKSDHAVH